MRPSGVVRCWPLPGLMALLVAGVGAEVPTIVPGEIPPGEVLMSSGTTAQLNDVWAASAEDAWAVGADATILHYDGNAQGAWTTLANLPTQLGDILAIDGNAPDNIYALAKSTRFERREVVLRYDGTSWSELSNQPVLQIERDTVLTDLWVAPTGEVVVSGGRNAPPFFVFPSIFLLRGGAWQVSGAFGSGRFGESGICSAVYGFSREELFALLNGKIFRFDGFGWSVVGDNQLQGTPPLFGLRAGHGEVHLYTHVPSGSLQSGFRHWKLSGDRPTFTAEIGLGLGATSSAVWGTSPERLLLAGASGTFGFDGGGLLSRVTDGIAPAVPLDVPVAESGSGLLATTGTSDGSVFTVGRGGTILGYKVGPRVLRTFPSGGARNVSPDTPVSIELDPGTIGFEFGTATIEITANGVPLQGGPVTTLGDLVLFRRELASLPPDALIAVEAVISDRDGTEIRHAWSFTTGEVLPPAPEVAIADLVIEGGQLCLSWEGGAGPYVVQESTDLRTWRELVRSEERSVKVPYDPTRPDRFVRVVSGGGNYALHQVPLDGSTTGSSGTGEILVQWEGDLLSVAGSFAGLTSPVRSARLKVRTEDGFPIQEVDLTSFLVPEAGMLSGTLQGSVRIPVDEIREPYVLVLCLGTEAHPDGELQGELTVGGTIVPPPTTKPALQAGGIQEPVRDGMFTEATCSYGCECGESVLLHSGEPRVTRSYLPVPGRGGIHFGVDLTYRGFSPGSFGCWHWQYQECLFQDENGNVIRNDGKGHIDTWVHRGGGDYTAPVGYFGTLRGSAQGWILRETNGFKRYYDRYGYLERYVDRFGNEMRFLYDWTRGGLVKIVDAFQRVYEVEHDPQTGAVTVIRDFSGRELKFGYDNTGKLAAITSPAVTGTSTGNDFPNGRTERFDYYSGFTGAQAVLNGKIKSCTMPVEVAHGGPPARQWLYGMNPADPMTFNKVIAFTKGGTNASGVAAGGTATFAYSMLNEGVPLGNPTVARGKVLVTEPNGNQYEYFANERSHHIETRHLTRGLREGEPTSYQTTRTFDEDGQLLSILHPEGNRELRTYQAGDRWVQKNVVEIRRLPDPGRGGRPRVWTMTYEPVYQQPLTIVDPRGNDSSYVPPIGTRSAARYTTRYWYDYQENFAAIPEADEWFSLFFFGLRNQGDLNGDGETSAVQGNCVRIERPVVQLEPGSNEALKRGSTNQEVVTQIAWNEFGQPISVTDAEGHVTRCSYYPESDPDGDGVMVVPCPGDLLGAAEAGYLAQCVRDADGLALTTTCRYDEVGNRSGVINPRGVETTFEHTQLNELVAITRGDDVTEAINRGELITGEAAYRYQSRFYYDENGWLVKREEENRGGTTPGVGSFVEQFFEYDILGNRLKRSEEIDADTTAVTRYRYDPSSLRVEVIAPEGNTVRYAYDERNLVYQVTRGAGTPEAATNRFDYDRNGNPVRAVDAEDHDGDGQPEATVWGYDGHDRRTRMMDALGNETTSTLDPASNVIHELVHGHPANQPGGNRVRLSERRWFHDELNRPWREDRALFVSDGFNPTRPVDLQDGNSDGWVTSRREYDALSRPTYTVEDDGEVTASEYDGVSRVVRVTDAVGNARTFQHDANGNVVREHSLEVSPDGAVPVENYVTHYVYDQLDRLVRATDHLGQTTRFSYDCRDNLVHRSDPEGGPMDDPLGVFPGQGQAGRINAAGNTTRFVFDGLNRLVRQDRDLRVGGMGEGALDTSNPDNPDGRITLTYEYHRNSNLAAIVDDNGNRTDYEYDALDRRVRRTNPDGTESRWAYDRDSNLVQLEDENGSVITHRYDVFNRLVRTEVQRGAGVVGTTRETYSYDGLSRLTRSSNDNGDPAREQVCENVYDSRGLRLEERQNGRVVSAAWSGDSKILQTVLPGGRELSRRYDQIDRVQSLSDQRGPISTHSNIGPGRRELERLLGNGVKEFSQYDGVKRLIGQRSLLPEGTPFVTRDYTYNRVNQRTSERRGSDSNLVDRYLYDSAYRVVHTLLDQEGAPGAAKREVSSITYDYDGVGNRRAVQRDGAAGPGTVAYTVNEVNEYTEVGATARTHDAKGNLVDDGRRRFAYDYANRLVNVTDRATGNPIAEYAYDVHGRRTRKEVYSATNPGVVGKRTTYSYEGWQVVEEQDGDTGNTEATYVWGPGYIDDLCQVERTVHHPLGAAVLYCHQNARHDVVAVTDASGAVVQKMRYDDFGKVVFFDAAGLPLVGDQTGIPYLFQGRRYDAESGLYHSRYRYYDPQTGRFLQRDPVWDASNAGNQYAFVGNGPPSRLDPFGLEGEGCVPKNFDRPSDQRPGVSGTILAALGGTPWRPTSSGAARTHSNRAFRQRIDKQRELTEKVHAGAKGALGVTQALVTFPLDLVDAFIPLSTIKDWIVEGLKRVPDSVIEGRYRALSAINSSRMQTLAGSCDSDDVEEYEKLETFFLSDRHRLFGAVVEYFTGGRVTQEMAMNMAPDGGLAGPGSSGVDSPALGAHAAVHDAKIYLRQWFGVGPGAGIGRPCNVLSGQVSVIATTLRYMFVLGEEGIDRPVGFGLGQQGDLQGFDGPTIFDGIRAP